MVGWQTMSSVRRNPVRAVVVGGVAAAMLTTLLAVTSGYTYGVDPSPPTPPSTDAQQKRQAAAAADPARTPLPAASPQQESGRPGGSSARGACVPLVIGGSGGAPLPPQAAVRADAEDVSAASDETRQALSERVYSSDERGAFEVAVCYTEASCEGWVRVRRRGGGCPPEAEAKAISSDKAYAAWVRREMGPEFFRLLLRSEVEVVQPMLVHEGGCEYRTPVFALSPPSAAGGQPHAYSIALEHLYTGYDGVDESKSFWPPLIKKSLLPVGAAAVAELQGTAWHPGQITLPSVFSLRCSGGSRQAAAAEGKPAVSGRDGFLRIAGGRWVVPAPLVGSQLYTKVRTKKVQRKPILFDWRRQAHPAYGWAVEGVGGGSGGAACVARLKGGRAISMLVTGDSQLRAAYFGVVNVLRGAAGGGGSCVRNISSPSHLNQYLFPNDPECVENVKGDHKHALGSLHAAFKDDPFAEKVKRNGAKHDVVVTGFAQHPASRKHWMYKRFDETMAERTGQVEDLLRKGRAVVWLMAPKYPDTKSGYAVGVMDWRTDPRLLLFNHAARQRLAALRAKLGAAAAARLHIVEAFEMSSPLSHTSSDQAHYNNLILDAMVQDILGFLCGVFAS